MFGVSDARFEELVAEALDELPGWVREHMENVEVVIEDTPSATQPDLLGQYHGIPLTSRGRGYAGVVPDTITLYRSTITGAAADEQQLREQVKHVVVHEVAHFFGISDKRLRELGRY